MHAKLNQQTEIAVGDLVFFVTKFRALAAARISGDVVSLVAPLLGGAGSLLDAWAGSDDDTPETVEGVDNSENGEGVDAAAAGESSSTMLDQNFGAILPALTDGLAKLDGRRLEAILLELLIQEHCISYEDKCLTQAVLDEVFCGDLMGLLTLAVEVIKLNYGSLFTMLGSQSGNRAVSALKNLT